MTRRHSRHNRRGGSGHQVNGQLALPLVPALTRANRTDLARLLESDWQDRAACAGTTDPDVFFPEDPEDPATCPAMSWPVDPPWLCSTCPVVRSCLIAALLHDEQGIWGRTTEAVRDDITTQLVAGGSVVELLDTSVPASPVSSLREAP